MPERKNQHYVPKHYLREWATEGKLHVFPISANKTFPEDTGSVCSRNYFYGNPPIVEEELANLDGLHARPFKELRNENNLTELSHHRIQLLLSFITTQRARSKATKEDVRQGEDYLRDAVEEDMEADRFERSIKWKSDLDKRGKEETLVEAHLLGIHHFLIALGIFGYYGINDLRGAVLYNLTDHEFVISDAPLVFDIPQYKRQLGLVPAGLGNRGLQIFCPIDQNRILLLYDPEVYRFNCNHRARIFVKSTNIIDELNLLQFHNAESIIMFNSSSEDYILKLRSRIDEVRQRKEISTAREKQEVGEFELEEAPAYQVPKLSPDLPRCRTLDWVKYTPRRPTCQVEKGRKIVYSIFNEVEWASDMGVICAIRMLEKQLGL